MKRRKLLQLMGGSVFLPLAPLVVQAKQPTNSLYAGGRKIADIKPESLIWFDEDKQELQTVNVEINYGNPSKQEIAELVDALNDHIGDRVNLVAIE